MLFLFLALLLFIFCALLFCNYFVTIAISVFVRFLFWIFFLNFIVPSAPPSNVTVLVISSSSLLITWSDVPMEQKNGKIIGYKIDLFSKNENEYVEIKNGSQFSFQKENLKKYYNYSIRIAAETSVGHGNYSAWIQKRTLQDSKTNVLFFSPFFCLTFLFMILLVCVSVFPLSVPDSVIFFISSFWLFSTPSIFY